jgi:hypothetical protein
MRLEGELGAAIAALVAVLFLGIGLWQFRRHVRLVRIGVRVTGTVVSIADPNGSSFPAVRFIDPTGSPHQVTLTTGGLNIKVRQVLSLIYPPSCPEQVVYDHPTALWLGPVGCLIVALVFGWEAVGIIAGR